MSFLQYKALWACCFSAQTPLCWDHRNSSHGGGRDLQGQKSTLGLEHAKHALQSFELARAEKGRQEGEIFHFYFFRNLWTCEFLLHHTVQKDKVKKQTLGGSSIFKAVPRVTNYSTAENTVFKSYMTLSGREMLA